MEFAVLLTNHPGNGYTARPLLFPELVVAGDTENDVLNQVRQAIDELQRRSRVVHVEVPAATGADPWLQFGGMWAEDPDWEQFQAAVATFRQAIETSTHTTQ